MEFANQDIRAENNWLRERILYLEEKQKLLTRYIKEECKEWCDTNTSNTASDKALNEVYSK